MISIAKLGADQARYYLEQAGERVDVADSLAGGLEDYYTDPHEARGQWVGVGAARLGLLQAVEPQHLRHLLNGLDPLVGRPLRQDGRRVSVAAFDVTFSAPKSVSVLFGTGSPEVRRAVRAGHDAAVREALAYLEDHAAAVRRGAGGAVVQAADGFVAATFRHRASRAGDPQLHTHTVIANVARGPDGVWSALDGRRIYAHAPAASRIYQAVLRAEITRALGLEWSPVKRGIAEIQGVPEPVRRAFSRRRTEIIAALDARGTSGHRAAEAAALATRAGKDRSIGARELLDEWRGRAEALGWSPSRVPTRLGRTDRLTVDEVLAQTVARLAESATLTARRSTFTRREVVIAVCDEVPVGTPLDARRIERAVADVIGSDEVVPIADAGERETFRRRDGQVLRVGVDERLYTTASLLAVEQRLLAAASAGRGAGRARVPESAVAAQLASRPTLSDEQRTMVEQLTTSSDAIAVVAGRAGTGKTFALAAAHAAWREAGHRVIGAAVARRAARELEHGAGVPSTSVAALLGALDRGRRLPAGTVLIVDEAGMLSTRDTAALADHVERAAGKLVLVGDDRQLPELEAGGAFRGLIRRGHAIELTENRRQAEPWERDAVEALRGGRAETALKAYQQHQRIHIAESPEATREQVVTDWRAAAGSDAVMIAARRTDVDDLNSRARSRLRIEGQLGEEELRIGHRSFAVGDRVVVRRNALELGLVNGERATVVGVDYVRDRLTLDCATNRVTVGASFLRQRTSSGEPALVHGYAMTCHVAQGGHGRPRVRARRQWALPRMGLHRTHPRPRGQSPLCLPGLDLRAGRVRTARRPGCDDGTARPPGRGTDTQRSPAARSRQRAPRGTRSRACAGTGPLMADPLVAAILQALASDPDAIATLREIVEVPFSQEPVPPPPAYTVATLAACLGVSEKAIRNAIGRHELAAVKLSGRWLIPIEAVRAWLSPAIPARRHTSAGPLSVAMSRISEPKRRRR